MPSITKREEQVIKAMGKIALDILTSKLGDEIGFKFNDEEMIFKRIK